MEHDFRNTEQERAFNIWWNDYFCQYFKRHAEAIATDERALWVVKIAYQAGLEHMAHIIQDALHLASATTVKPTKSEGKA